MAHYIDNKKIVKNTVYLYIRTLITLLVSLFSSRLLLEGLGVTNLGIYNVVGGIVAMMSFFQSTLTQSTSRFITYELGRNESDPESIFAICFTIHILVALIILLFGGTIGLYVVNYYTDIPNDRVIAANIVFHFSLISLMISVIRIPLDSLIVAHEEMSIYAYMSLVEAGLLFVVSYSITLLKGDSLIIYGVLHLLTVIILFFCYFSYIRKKHPEYKFHLKWDRDISRHILSFSGWTLLGSTSGTFSQQGVSLLFNNFVGLVANAALGFANQVNTAVNRFINSFTTAFKPQIVKLCAGGEYQQLQMLMFRASKFSFILAYAIGYPIIVNMDFLLNIWLVNVPRYTTSFCQLILICSIIDATTGSLNTAITATGKIRNYQVFISCSFLLDLCFCYLLLKYDYHPAVVFGSRILTRGLLNMLIGLYYCRKQILFDVVLYLKRILIPILFVVFVTILLVKIQHGFITNNIVFFISSTVVIECALLIMLIYVICNVQERKKFLDFIIKKIK